MESPEADPVKTKTLQPDYKFRAFMEAAPDAIVVVNRQGRMEMLNSLAEKMFGYSRSEMLNQSVEMLVPDQLRHKHMGHRTNYFHDPHTRRMGEGQALTGKRKDGTEFPIEISLSPYVDENENFVISIIRDTTSRQKLEAKFRGLLESAPDGIVVVDPNAKIVIVNSQTEKMFGYARSELVGQAVEILVPVKYKEDHLRYRDGYIHDPHTRPMGAGRILTGRRKDGSEVPVEISLSPLETEQGMLIMSIIRDITDRRKAEEQIKNSLREKEALLKEIHHRVKNNLQVTSSLLRLQSGYIQDPHTLEMFVDSQNRIRSMALVHEKLYKSSDLSRIDFAEYVNDLALLLLRSFAIRSDQVTFELSKQPVVLSVETAVPCGLIVNELLSNAFKHAFPDGRQGKVEVTVAPDRNSGVLLKVCDNGIGLPEGFSFDATETLGLQLIRTLVNQINGNIDVLNQNGVCFIITFTEAKSGL